MDYLYIGSAPSAEDCVSVNPKQDYLPAMKQECVRYIERVKEYLRLRNIPYDKVEFALKGEEHDFGKYYEVIVKYDEKDEESVGQAYSIENNCPEYWDERKESNKEIL